MKFVKQRDMKIIFIKNVVIFKKVSTTQNYYTKAYILFITVRGGMHMFDAFVKLVNTVGFPIGVSIYLLVRFEKKIEDLNKSISELTSVISAVIGKYEK
jgi:hypothetical protein